MADDLSATQHRATTFSGGAEIDDFLAELRRFERRQIDAEAWRAYRVVRGRTRSARTASTCCA